MKYLKKSFLILCISLILLGLNSCVKDILGDININEDYRDKYIGDWTCTETPTKSIKLTYTVNIYKDPENSSRVYLENFGYCGEDEKPAYGIATESSITIPEQTICDDDSWIVEGIGYLINSKKMTWEYSINDGADLSNYTAIFVKK